MKFTCVVAALLTASIASCGGSKSGDGTGPGHNHSTKPDDGDIEGIDADQASSPADAGVEAPPAAPVTFVLKNSAKSSLFLNMDKGWQAVIYAYSGTPPNAKSILMFPTYCTASCDSSPEDVCPYCPQPERAKDIQAAENHDDVKPGDSRSVPWDGMAFSYQNAKGTQNGKKAKCKCSELVEPEPATYTIKACGLRKTQSAEERSKYQCVESTLTLPVEGPTVVELDFGKPEK